MARRSLPDPHRARYEIRDPVHGLVRVSDAELDIINTPAFQRLRDVRQLAVAHFVYPGATHTRFEHSIGCMHLSSRVLEAVAENGKAGKGLSLDDAFRVKPDDSRSRLLLRLAALLHDLGHPPFSHSGEYLFPDRTTAGRSFLQDSGLSPEMLDDRNRLVDHEDMTAQLIRSTEVAERIERHYENVGIGVEDVIAVATRPSLARGYKTRGIDSFLHQVLTGDLGTDRMDYLLRDAHHSGQPTGAFDIDRLASEVAIIEPPEQSEMEGDVALGLLEDGRLVAEHLYVARYVMYVSLYFHKTKRIYEKHMERFMPHWLAARELEALPTDVSQFVALSESDVWAEVRQAASNPTHPGHSDARVFFDRSHHRVVAELLPVDRRVLERVVVDGIAGSVKTFEKVASGPPDPAVAEVRDLLVQSVPAEELIGDEPKNSAYKFLREGSQILVLDGRRVEQLGRLSEIVSGMSDQIWRYRFYAPPSKTDAARGRFEDWRSNKTPKVVEYHARVTGEASGVGGGGGGVAEPSRQLDGEGSRAQGPRSSEGTGSLPTSVQI